MKKRVMGWLLALVMAATLLPVQALAAELEQPDELQHMVMYQDPVTGEIVTKESTVDASAAESGIATYEIVVDTDENYNYNDDVHRYGREALGELDKGWALQFIYDVLLAVAKMYDGDTLGGKPMKYDESIGGYEGAFFRVSDLGVTITPDDAWLVASTIRNDNPELFWIMCAVGWDRPCDYTGVCSSVGMYYYKYDTPFDEMKQNFMNAADNILKGAPQNGSNYEIEKYVHDALVAHVDYNLDEMDQGAYATLVKGEGVCAGYARAFQYLLQCVGIESFVVTGKTTRGSHAWDMVKLGDNWHFVDPTWDDAGNQLSYTYFNRGTDFMQKTHEVDPERNVPVEILHDYISDEFAYVMQLDGSLSVGGCRGEAEDLVIPRQMKGASVTTIQKNSRYLFGWNSSMKSVTIPDTVTSIGSNAFENYTALEAVFIPVSVTTLVTGAFSGCTSLKDVYYTGTAAQWRKLTQYNRDTYLTGATIHYVLPGDLNGSGSAADASDVQCLYTYLTGGGIDGALAQRETFFKAVADVNGDGSVDVYDLQRLYETVSGAA